MQTRKEIPGSGGLYFASDDGKIFRVDSISALASCIGNHGYPYVTVVIDGVRKKHCVHRLVALAFHGQPAEGEECCHKDGNKLNAVPSNLRWDTRSENAKDRYRHGYILSADGRAKISKANRGRPPLTVEHRAKLAAAKIGNKNRLGGKKYLEANHG
jgi:hypothetical protein